MLSMVLFGISKKNWVWPFISFPMTEKFSQTESSYFELLHGSMQNAVFALHACWTFGWVHTNFFTPLLFFPFRI
jgi:hypothetical protein